ncbi:MAG TPA: glycosyltransferase family 2 protein, partial [Vicinamibacterales bacterium]|nr:glycosyltransferase family 2 protein [Vicinamibacterales bacterium]
MPNSLISIIVPVYNEAGTIRSVLDRLLAIHLPADREIIVVNDGSSDGTRDVLDALTGLSDRITIVHVDPNRGKGHAVRLGIARSKGDVVAIQDADLELDPAQLAALVQPILDGQTDVIYGSRFLTPTTGVPLVSRLANAGLTMFTNLLYGGSLTDMETCYKIMRGSVARSLPLTADRFDIEPEITATLLTSGHRIKELPVTFSPRSRAAGKKIRWQ